MVPERRIRVLRDQPPAARGRYVLYWMIAARRRRRNFALQRAVEWAVELGRPLVVLEALRVGYPHASDRLHRFVLDGMAAHRRVFTVPGVTYLPYVEPHAGAGRGLLGALAADACVVVTDDYPTFFLPAMVEAARAQLSVRLEQVDGIGLLPMRSAGRTFHRAVDFRRHLQRTLPEAFELPAADPLAGAVLPPAAALPDGVSRRWPAANPRLLDGDPSALAALPIDHGVPVTATRGGATAAHARMREFVDRLDRYAERANHPDDDATSGLSAYLHFGHLGAHELFAALADAEDWSPDRLGDTARGQRAGWWGVGPSAEALLDQLVTWRELGYAACAARPGCAGFDDLPAWARQTLAEHENDPRDAIVSREVLEAAATDDPLWNAAQRQLLREGRIHGYLRMLWGKKVLGWTASPRAAFDTLAWLNDRHALDGRDPNSYSGIGWVFGKYDRPWGPERPVFGKVRYMTSASARRKLRLRGYVARYGEGNG